MLCGQHATPPMDRRAVGHAHTPISVVAHRNLIGHYEIDPITRANCPGPTVQLCQIAIDANANTGDIFGQIVLQSSVVHVYGTTAPGLAARIHIVKQFDRE